MSGLEARDNSSDEEAQREFDRAVEEAVDMEFATFEEVKRAFRR